MYKEADLRLGQVFVGLNNRPVGCGSSDNSPPPAVSGGGGPIANKLKLYMSTKCWKQMLQHSVANKCSQRMTGAGDDGSCHNY